MFDVIVIGGGHAGAEAARVCARGGARTAMVTMLRDAIGRMSCNPAIGGLAKGNLVKEIDALGGLMGEATDRAGIQFKVLNRSKGPAVQGPRAQCDRDLYARAVQDILTSEPNLTLVEASISALIHAGPSVTGVVLHDGSRLRAHSVVVTTGTFLRALMYSGQIKATGPRYCPSIEDKVVRFADKERHQVFVEPEGLQHPWLYLNGISTSLPPDVQEGVVHSLPGFSQALIARYGYAVEYDFVNPEQLDPTLQVRGVEGLFLAGQINGTSGYEEAAAQGLIAGMNALQAVRGSDPVILRRDRAYTGVMVDDLVTLGTTEPYRMFTSRAEHRLLLGCDSVYERLSPIAESLGVLDDDRRRRIADRIRRMSEAKAAAEETTLTPDRDTLAWLHEAGVVLTEKISIAKLMQRHGLDLDRFLDEAEVPLSEMTAAFRALAEEESEGVVSQLRYAGYIERQAG